ncbi:MAG: pyridoxal-phosphate dependent enzyme [Candidatus Sericytochromatia bacterium]
MTTLHNLRRWPSADVLPLLALALGQPSPDTLQKLWQAYQQTQQGLWGWVEAGRVLALAGVQQTRPGVGVLQHLAVVPEARQRGLGRLLLRALTQQLGLYRLEAETDAEACGFYQRCGWTLLPLGSRPGRQARWLACWLSPEEVLRPDFVWPLPPLEPLTLPDAPAQPLQVCRLDLLHPLLGGNKLYKLWGHLQGAQAAGASTLLSFGGAWSNHLLALAAAGRLLGFATVGVLRGEPPATPSPVLQQLTNWGMHLHWVTRSDYRLLRAELASQQEPATLRALFPDAWVIPEGGGGPLGQLGLRQLWPQLPPTLRSLACACGTGTTLVGLAAALNAERPAQKVSLLGVSVLKGDFLRAEIAAQLGVGAPATVAWELDTESHAGGYARVNPDLQHFLERFGALNSLPLEPVYTGKLLWGLNRRAREGRLPPIPLVALHTGGIWPWSGTYDRL